MKTLTPPQTRALLAVANGDHMCAKFYHSTMGNLYSRGLVISHWKDAGVWDGYHLAPAGEAHAAELRATV